MRFCVSTLGCKVNQFESQALESILLSRGHELLRPGEGCDVCVINTCAVTAESSRKSRQAVRRLKKLEPDASIAVCGCLSQLEPFETATLGVDFIGGSGDREEFALAVERLEKRREISKKPPGSVFEELPPGVAAGRTRGMLKIQDGCDNFCAYCVIPYARGPSRSLPVERAAEAARLLEAEGVREIVVTGIEISSYGKDVGATLTDAIRAVGQAAPGARLRLGSLDSGAVTGDFCRELADVNLCRHFHLSLQSGCDDTLRRMGRKYGADVAYDAIQRLRRSFPDCGITADLITGFPGETDEEFERTLEFIKSAKFSDMHIFPFSPRPGTKAFDMAEQVEKSVRRARAGIAKKTAREMSRDFKRSQIGKTLDVLFERERVGEWIGYSDNYLEVVVKNGGSWNSIHSVQITAVENDLVWGEIIGL